MARGRWLWLWLWLAAMILAGQPVFAKEPPSAPDWAAPHRANPLLPGSFADPSILKADGRWYIYATIDPWGGERLGVWESRDFANWTYHELNWPTKAAATSATSGPAMVWAPSVIKGPDGRFWMYVSVGSEVWVGVADAPLGPWRNALGDRPLIPGDYRPGFHMIDAEAFIDDDGQAYLYWGSGLNWVNGRCFAVKLKPDMIHFDGEPIDVTPAHYFEAPFMVKRDGRYFLTYSNGKTTEDNYEVRYAVGSTPLGPFVEGGNSPILKSDTNKQIISPGHHTIFQDADDSFILYHRQRLPFAIGQGQLHRQIAIDRLTFGSDSIEPVVPTHRGARPGASMRVRSLPFLASASSEADDAHGANRLNDDNYATFWQAADGSAHGWVQADLGSARAITGSEIRPEYPGRTYHFAVSTSLDGKNWKVAVSNATYRGSPIMIEHPARTRFLRLETEAGAGLLEWVVKR